MRPNGQQVPVVNDSFILVMRGPYVLCRDWSRRVAVCPNVACHCSLSALTLIRDQGQQRDTIHIPHTIHTNERASLYSFLYPLRPSSFPLPHRHLVFTKNYSDLFKKKCTFSLLFLLQSSDPQSKKFSKYKDSD